MHNYVICGQGRGDSFRVRVVVTHSADGNPARGATGLGSW